jgi:hypothetical protein
MTQLGEGVAVGIFIPSSDTAHSESTCPWHGPAEEGSAKPMEKQACDEDGHAPIPPNLGEKLGKNLDAAKDKEPAAVSVTLHFRPAEVITFKAGAKEVQRYAPTEDQTRVYPLQYAPHHLVPGNESLKGSAILPFMGAASVIEDYKPPSASKIKDGKSIGYDVNAAENGVWLPSPYALSMNNKWPSQDGIKALLKQFDQRAVDDAEAFKAYYTAASIENSGGRQFHMRHAGYSVKVKEILNAMADKVKVSATQCPVTGSSDGKFDPPTGLKAKLNGLSSRLRSLLTGPVWHPPFFTDDLSNRYLGGRVAVQSDTSHLRLM